MKRLENEKIKPFRSTTATQRRLKAVPNASPTPELARATIPQTPELAGGNDPSNPPNWRGARGDNRGVATISTS